jgi:hypothetical protein
MLLGQFRVPRDGTLVPVIIERPENLHSPPKFRSQGFLTFHIDELTRHRKQNRPAELALHANPMNA